MVMVSIIGDWPSYLQQSMHSTDACVVHDESPACSMAV